MKVTKQIDCDDDTEGDCEDLLELVNENDYNIQVTGNNPDPSSPFPGSPPPTGTDVTLGPGDYQVTETNANSLFQHVNTFFLTHPSSGPVTLGDPSFTGDCNGISPSRATGTIAVGEESQTCNIINSITIG